jgi:transcription antitermination factor NusG
MMAQNWYCIRSKPNKEEFLCSQLLASQIETFYPRLRVKPVNPRSSKIRPYFPGYMFVNVDLEKVGANSLHWMPGALGLVSYGNEPAPVQDELVNAIRNRVKMANAALEGRLAGLKAGDRVQIEYGPFAGYEAIFDVHLPGSERVRVFLALLERRGMKVELPWAYIQPLARH